MIARFGITLAVPEAILRGLTRTEYYALRSYLRFVAREIESSFLPVEVLDESL